MNFIRSLLTLLLLIMTCNLFAEGVEIINLKSGDQVNANKFTIVAFGYGFQDGDQLRVQVVLTNETTGIVSKEDLTVFATKTGCTGWDTLSSNGVEIVNLSDGDCVNQDRFSIVAKGTGFAAGDGITAQVRILNFITGVESSETIFLTAK